MSLIGIIASSKLVAAPLPPVAGYTLWLDAADTSTITASGGDVSQWSDKSGNARNFTQSSATAKPKTGTRTINGLNTIDFDGTNDFLSCPSSTSFFNYLHNSTGGTFFIVGIVDDNAAAKVIFDNSGGSSSNIGIEFHIKNDETDFILVVNGTSGQSSIFNQDRVQFVDGDPYQIAVKVKANASASDRYKISLNQAAELGTNAETRAPSASNSSNSMHLGILSNGVNTPYNGCFGEIIFYSGILSSGDIDSIETYLADKWGL